MPDKSDGNRPRRGRPPRISRAAIAQAALAVGLDNVTLEAIAAHLNADHSSLYRHVQGRDDIMLAAADLAVTQLDWRTETDDWRVFVANACAATWTLYERHPGLANVIQDLSVTPPAIVRSFAEAVQYLQSKGFELENAILVMDSAMDLTVDAFVGWSRMEHPANDGRSVGETLMRSWVDEAVQTPRLAREINATINVFSIKPKDWWQRKLDLLLDGASTLLAAQSKP